MNTLYRRLVAACPLRGPKPMQSPFKPVLRKATCLSASLVCALALGAHVHARSANLPIAEGPFKPEWNSLTNYQCPEWFRDAKFGIWAHWGAQCVPEEGHWYARTLYMQGGPEYKAHLAKYGHPSTNGFKDIIRLWKAEKFEPDKLVDFYKENGARYFMALANHHDNFDNFDSKYQPWNSVQVGPHQDLIAGWAKAARKSGLRFGVSIHNSHAWSWYEPSQGADTNGPLAGVPYDGKLTKADGKGQWWDGLDPQALYAQNHPPGRKMDWRWNPQLGSSLPDAAYLENFFQRTRQVWDDYQPDQIYFDDSVLPFHGLTDEIGLRLAAHFYNSSLQRHGRNEAVMNAKKLDEVQRKALVYDIERGKAEGILPEPWQTDTCIGRWFYMRDIAQEHSYKSAEVVVRMLADIVSKNGNLLLSVPQRADGSIDADEVKIIKEIGAWLKLNGEAIYGTRPWKIYGEGPSTRVTEAGRYGGQSDTQKAPFTPEDIRFTQSKDGKTLYAIMLATPASQAVTIKSLAKQAPCQPANIRSVRLLGAGQTLAFTWDEQGLHVLLPEKGLSPIADALKISL